MAAVDLTADLPMTPQDMWNHVSDLSDLGDWLVMHEGWRSELPDEIAEGTQIVGVARAKGLRNRVTWTVTTWDPPHEMAMSGSGKGGAKYAVTLTVRPSDEGSTLGLRLELGGRALFGPVGSTGGVITAAGVIFAASMFGLLFASISTLVQSGFIIGTGLLLDTFLVRTITVPSIAVLVGKANWWPSRLPPPPPDPGTAEIPPPPAEARDHAVNGSAVVALRS
ncbi:MAG TPA: SRPBCC family protein [Mycobacterium sp.]